MKHVIGTIFLQTFLPLTKLDPCVWFQCIDPPLPADKGLKHNWNGDPVEFGSNVTYSCARANLFFEVNHDLRNFDLHCLKDGSFEEPANWLSCVSSKVFYLNIVNTQHSKIVLIEN